MIRTYESMIIVSSSNGEEAAKKENEKIHSLLKENDAEVIKTDDWGKRELAYEITKMKEGYYFINYFKADAETIKKLEKLYRINENIIRFNMVVS